jgi:hypothetical protein
VVPVSKNEIAGHEISRFVTRTVTLSGGHTSPG